MKTLTTKRTVLGLLLGGFFLFEANVAEAVIGAPLTPVSVAGVARRTTRRAVVATSAAAHSTPAPAPATTTVVVVPAAPAPAPTSSSASTASSAPAPTTFPAAAPAPSSGTAPATFPASAPAPAAAPPVGTVVTSLPPGSQSVGDYFVSNNVYYQPTIQGSKLVYVVVAPK